MAPIGTASETMGMVGVSIAFGPFVVVVSSPIMALRTLQHVTENRLSFRPVERFSKQDEPEFLPTRVALDVSLNRPVDLRTPLVALHAPVCGRAVRRQVHRQATRAARARDRHDGHLVGGVGLYGGGGHRL